MPVEQTPDLVLHELHHLVLDRSPLRIRRNLLTHRTVLATILVVQFILRSRPVHVHRQQTMHHDVRITPDRRSEMRVILERKTIVPHIVRRITRPCHAAQGQQLERILLRLALGLLHQVVQRTCCPLRIGRITQLVPEILRETPQRIELLRIRILVDTIDERRILRLALFRRIFGHAAVRQQHELLDEPVALAALLLDDIDRLARLIDDHLHLGPLERNGPFLETLRAQNRRQSMQIEDFRCQRPLLRFDDLLRLLIIEPVVRIDNRAAEPLRDDLRLGVHLEHGTESQLVLVRTERAEPVRQLFGQHRDGAVHQIDRRTARESFLVERRAGCHIMRHVGDVDAHLDVSVLQLAV